jgi:hypothetical protein
MADYRIATTLHNNINCLQVMIDHPEPDGMAIANIPIDDIAKAISPFWLPQVTRNLSRSQCQLPEETDEPFEEPEPPKKKKSSLGLGMILLSWGLCLVLFPKYVGLDGPLAGVFFVVGLVLMLIGLLGTFLEAFPERGE